MRPSDVAAAATCLLAIGGCPPVATALPPNPPSVPATRDHLESLRVRPSGTLDGYSRDRFGDGWASTGDGCDVRERVLVRDGRNVKVDRQCRPTSGRWRSVYDGTVTRRSALIDIDHVVPLAEAWRSGARQWTKVKRARLANDLEDSQLIAVSRSSNRSKGDSDPAEWKPPRKAVWCLYARWWIDVKHVWRLAVDQPEADALQAMLRQCR